MEFTVGKKEIKNLSDNGIPKHSGKFIDIDQDIQIVSLGLSNVVQEKVEKKLEKIEITAKIFNEILEEFAKDLMQPRRLKKLNSNTETTLQFLREFDSKNKIFYFNVTIDEIKEYIVIPDEDLSDFLSSFLYSNITNYIKKLYNALPEDLPANSVEVIGNEQKRVKMTIL